MIPVEVSINKNDIIFRTGDEKVIYKTDVNAFLADTGVTIKNIRLPFKSKKVFYIKLKDLGESFVCGNSLKNALLEMEKDVENSLIIIDFNEVKEISGSFLKNYIQFILETSNRVFTINMNTEISNIYSEFISTNILEDDEEEE